MAGTRPLCQVFEGSEEFVDCLFRGVRIVGRDKVLDPEQIFECLWRKLIRSHEVLLRACCAQSSPRFFRTDYLALIQLLEAAVNLFAYLGQPSLLGEFLLL